MATVLNYWALGSSVTLLSTELNSLASSATLAAGAIATVGGTSGKFNNVYSGGGLGGYPMGEFELSLAAPAAGLTAGTAAYIWFLNSVDGTNFEDGSNSIIPTRPADLIIPVRAVTGAQRIIVVAPLPPNLFFPLLSHNTGQNWNASGNNLKVVPVTNQVG